jgi:hypothetical protein
MAVSRRAGGDGSFRKELAQHVSAFGQTGHRADIAE